MKTIVTLATFLLALGAPVLAAAQPAPDAPPPAEPAKSDRGAFVAGAKVGAGLPFSGMTPMVSGAVQVGYVLPFLKRSFGLLIDVAYTVPTKSGTVMNDPRVDGGKYDYSMTQKELTIMPAAYYRLTMLGRAVPYIGIGPRVYLHQSTVSGTVGKEMILETKEQTTRVGFGLPVGCGITLGPGELVAEFLFEWGKFGDEKPGTQNSYVAPGDKPSMAGTINVGYRFLL
jgi:opacity protein-like surface antigen